MQAQPALALPSKLDTEFTQEVALCRPFLLHLARRQLPDKASAEDAVQDTLSSAWQGWGTFEQRSSIRTWLVSILRFKIIDMLRKNRLQRGSLHTSSDFDENTCTDHDATDPPHLTEFDAQGHWQGDMHAWGEDVSDNVAQRQLLDMLQVCLTRLPLQLSQTVLNREYLGLDMAEIAAQQQCTEGSVRTQLYRARMALRLCLNQKFQT